MTGAHELSREREYRTRSPSVKRNETSSLWTGHRMRRACPRGRFALPRALPHRRLPLRGAEASQETRVRRHLSFTVAGMVALAARRVRGARAIRRSAVIPRPPRARALRLRRAGATGTGGSSGSSGHGVLTRRVVRPSPTSPSTTPPSTPRTGSVTPPRPEARAGADPDEPAGADRDETRRRRCRRHRLRHRRRHPHPSPQPSRPRRLPSRSRPPTPTPTPTPSNSPGLPVLTIGGSVAEAHAVPPSPGSVGQPGIAPSSRFGGPPPKKPKPKTITVLRMASFTGTVRASKAVAKPGGRPRSAEVRRLLLQRRPRRLARAPGQRARASRVSSRRRTTRARRCSSPARGSHGSTVLGERERAARRFIEKISRRGRRAADPRRGPDHRLGGGLDHGRTAPAFSAPHGRPREARFHAQNKIPLDHGHRPRRQGRELVGSPPTPLDYKRLWQRPRTASSS